MFISIVLCILGTMTGTSSIVKENVLRAVANVPGKKEARERNAIEMIERFQ